jgi:hypothetical protein
MEIHEATKYVEMKPLSATGGNMFTAKIIQVWAMVMMATLPSCFINLPFNQQEAQTFLMVSS